ncbi:hypothetical protein V5799_019595 [Amblyomma americanum]|uniref:Methyltransferase type 11 domain-containing protein n=1 Tax=Amblyomma americanum TaxID=6943 RepID=A0AAQ4EW05_AMBAM
MPPTTSPAGSSGKERDPRTFLWLREHNYRDNLKALDSVQFRRPAEVGDQYLDVGCGPGNFVAEALLPRLGHCRRLIATDKAASMVEYAREHYPNPAVVYDVLDIERGDVQSFVGKYGLFDRVYSFMAFHYVNDLERAYRNVFLALKDGGEFMRVSFTGTAITDVWYQLYCTEEWKAFLSFRSSCVVIITSIDWESFFLLSAASGMDVTPLTSLYTLLNSRVHAGMIFRRKERHGFVMSLCAASAISFLIKLPSLCSQNPKKLLSQRFCYCAPIPLTEIADNEEKAVAAAGLELVSCQLYDSYWTKPDVDSWLDSYVPFFRLDSGVPAERRAAFREAFRSLLLKASIATPKGRDLRHSVIVVHAQKPPRP